MTAHQTHADCEPSREPTGPAHVPAASSLAVVPVRGGTLPPGAEEAVAEAGGAALLVGDGTSVALPALTPARRAWTAEFPRGRRPGPGTTAAALAPALTQVHTLILPSSADGRDVAPRLAHALGRPLLAEATEVLADGAVVSRRQGSSETRLTARGPFVATLSVGVRGVEPVGRSRTVPEPLALSWPTDVADAHVLEILDPDPTGTPLSEATRVLGAGGGMGGAGSVRLLHRLATVLGASVGATRVVTDAGLMPQERQIGTTGTAVDPDVYIAFGVSGAVQHTGGLGAPRLVISVNTDPHCPMTTMADVGIVADAPAVLAELCSKLEASGD